MPQTIVRSMDNPLAALVKGDYIEISLDRDAGRPADVPDDLERHEVPSW